MTCKFKLAKTYTFFIVLLFCNSLTAQTWEQVWAEEFENSVIDRSTWSFGEGTTNDNIHYYTDREDNAKIVDGKLQIIAHEESYQGFNYTSALLQTKNSVNWRYGRIEARIKLPASNGFVPAFWLLPVDDQYGWWPVSGEIDIMEHPTNEVNKIYGTVHTGAYNSFTGSGPSGDSVEIPTAETDYHVYAVEWTPEKIDFYVDTQKYFTYENDNGGFVTWPFDQPFYIILNVAVGGAWVGTPDANTVFPAIMEVDYVRVYQALDDLAIYGPAYQLKHSTGTYFTHSISDASYTWNIGGDAQIVSGQGTHQVEVNWGTQSQDIQLTVTTGGTVYNSTYPVVVSSNQLKNGSFEKGVKYWDKTGPFPAEADFLLTSNDVHSGSNALYVNVKTPGFNPWDAQLSYSDVSIEFGEEYEVSFRAKTDDPGSQISASVINADNFTIYGQSTYTLTNAWAEYGFSFTASENADAVLAIDMGGHIGRYYFDDFSLMKPEDEAPPDTTGSDNDTTYINLVQNHDFSDGDQNWVFSTFASAQATSSVINGELAVNISNGGLNRWEIYFGQENFIIEQGKQYTVSFDAYASAPRDISPIVGMNASPWTVYSGDQYTSLTTEKQTYSFTFVMNEATDNQARMGFDIGASNQDVFFDNIYLVEAATTSVSENKPAVPQSFKLFQNHPNPFNAGTNIQFDLAQQEFVELTIFDLLGRKVVTLLSGEIAAGAHSVHWNADNTATGVYFYRMTTGSSSLMKRMTLIK